MKAENYYGLDGWERLESSIYDVIEKVFEDNCVKAGEPYEVIADRIEWPIKIEVYVKNGLTEKDAQRIADDAIERFCETYDADMGDPDGDPFEPTQAMKDAALAFGKACVADYVPFICEPTGSVIEYTREMSDFDEKGLTK